MLLFKEIKQFMIKENLMEDNILREKLEKLEVPKMIVWVDKEMQVETTNLTTKTIDEILALVEQQVLIGRVNEFNQMPTFEVGETERFIIDYLDSRLTTLKAQLKK